MHSPPRKVTVKDQALWKIPPCISNWKNSKGYTIPLDKRLAADGRGLQEVQINDKFAKLSSALYVAERNAREEVTVRAQIQTKVKQREKEKKEEQLRRLAEEARQHRGGGGAAAAVAGAPSREAPEEPDEDEEKEARENIRRERTRERQRELRMEAAGKKGKGLRDEDRDVSEKIALGMGGGGGGPQSEEALFDQRLFNQTQGLEGGFGDDDSYNIYSKPLMGNTSASAIYRPGRGKAEEFSEQDMDKILKTNKFRPDKEFEGVDRSKPVEPRNKPVEFEKEPEEDPFGLDEFLSTAKKGKRPLDKIGTKGALHAGSAGSKDYQSQDKDSKRKKIDFEGSRSKR
jgi:SNW domain-containing protein 1